MMSRRALQLSFMLACAACDDAQTPAAHAVHYNMMAVGPDMERNFYNIYQLYNLRGTDIFLEMASTTQDGVAVKASFQLVAFEAAEPERRSRLALGPLTGTYPMGSTGERWASVEHLEVAGRPMAIERDQVTGSITLNQLDTHLGGSLYGHVELLLSNSDTAISWPVNLAFKSFDVMGSPKLPRSSTGQDSAAWVPTFHPAKTSERECIKFNLPLTDRSSGTPIRAEIDACRPVKDLADVAWVEPAVYRAVDNDTELSVTRLALGADRLLRAPVKAEGWLEVQQVERLTIGSTLKGHLHLSVASVGVEIDEDISAYLHSCSYGDGQASMVP